MNTDLIAQRALDHWNRSGFASLDETERTVAAVWLFEAQVENNGFEHFICGRYGDGVAHTPAALRAVGALSAAELADEAIRVLGGGIPSTKEARIAAVRSLTPEQRARWAEIEDRFFACDEDLDELLEHYLTKLPR